jgi:PAS domain S-box-containing protein
MKSSKYRGNTLEIKVHDHACMVYDTIDEWCNLIVSFIIEGLDNNEKCGYILGSSTAEETNERLISSGIDTSSYRKSGQLFFLPYTRSYLSNGCLNPQTFISFLDSETKKAVDEGYSALRITGEMDWILGQEDWELKLLEHQSELDKFIQEHPCSLLAQYCHDSFSWPALKYVTMSYPLVVYKESVCRNPNFVSPDMLLKDSPEQIEESLWFRSLTNGNSMATTIDSCMKAMESVEIPFMVSLPDGSIEFWNESFRELIGYTDDELSNINVIKDLTPPKWREQEMKMQNWLSNNLKPLRYEKEYICKDGSCIPVELLVQQVSNNNGQVTANITFINNIAEIKEIKQYLTASEKKYEALVSIINDGLVIIQDGIIKFANEAMLKLLEISRDQIIDRPFIEFIRPDYKREILSQNKERQEGNGAKVINEVVMMSGKGRSLPIEITATAVMHDGQPAEMLVLRDLTKTKSTERIFNTLSSGTPMGLFIIQDGNFKFVGSQFEKITGYNIEEAVDLVPQKLVHPDDSKMVRKNAIDMLKGLRSTPYEYRIIRKNGQLAWFVESVASIDYQGRRAVMIAGIDITEQKRAEAVRKEAEQRSQIASRLATVGEMAAGIAHEINNPLTTVIGYTELLMQSDIPDSIRKDLRFINNGAQRVADIVHRMLTFARQTKPERRYVNINDVIQNTLDMQLYSLNNNNIQVETRLEKGLPLTMADSGQLQQVFLNLIINAMTEMKMSHGGGKLQIQTRQVENIIRITFKDSGPGISRENIEKIFNPFFTTREIGKGTGLGLSVCHGIVTGHNGKIYVKSKSGKGATFFVDLPILMESTQLEFGETEIPEVKNKVKARILVVDDELLIRRLLTRILTKEGHNVDCVDNAMDALEKIRTERYNLILLDIMMPGMSGINLYESIKDIAISLTQRVVFITGDVMGNETQKFLAKTRSKYFTKPFETNRLRKEINKMLSTPQT